MKTGRTQSLPLPVLTRFQVEHSAKRAGSRAGEDGKNPTVTEGAATEIER